jgi:histidinol-phosphate aminotransferase
MNFDFLARKGVPDIKPYIPGKPIEEVKRELGIEGEIIKLASNENPLGVSPKAKEAIQNHLDECHLYPDGGGFALRRKIADKFDITPEQIALGTGSSEAIELILKAFVERDEEVIAGAKGFAMYRVGPMIVGCKGVYIPEKEDNRHDLNGMLNAISGKTKLIFIDNPANPLGTMLTRDELKKFLDAVPQNVLVVLDEAYNEYVSDPDFPDSLNDFFPHMNNLIILRTFSKIYGLASMRIGYVIAHPDIISLINKVRQPFNTARLAQIGAIAAIDDEEHIKRSKELNDKGKEYLYQELDKMGLSYTKSYTNFILVEVEKDAKEVFLELQKKGVVIRPMNGYGMPTCIRITVGTQPQNQKFIQKLKEVL